MLFFNVQIFWVLLMLRRFYLFNWHRYFNLGFFGLGFFGYVLFGWNQMKDTVPGEFDFL